MADNERLISLDVFRGMTIAGMVLVNNPGTWAHIYDPLEHAAWHGMTPTDWIFPFFLFIVGVAIPISLGKRLREGVDSSVYRRILSRSALIFGLGLLMSAIPFFQFAGSDASDPVKMLVWLVMTAGLFFALLRKWKVAGVLAGLTIAGVVMLNLAGYNLVTYSFGTMRIPGVLQRIAVCYLVVAILFLNTNWKQLLGIGAGLLLVYWALMTLIPVPGCEVTTIDDKACNLAAWLDRTILTENHIWRSGKVFDPEGILSTLPAIVTTISGVLTGLWLKTSPPYEGVVAAASAEGVVLPGEGEVGPDKLTVHDDKDRIDTAKAAENLPVAGASTPLLRMKGSRNSVHDATRKAAGMFFFGTVLLAVGYIWSSYFPLNKSLWTSSYVLATSGIALLVLAACYWLIDIKGYKRWAMPFVVFGVNALPLFVFSGIMARMLGAYRVTAADGKPVSIQKWIFDSIYMSIAQPVDASLLYAISFILLWLFLMWLLYRKRIFVRV